MAQPSKYCFYYLIALYEFHYYFHSYIKRVSHILLTVKSNRKKLDHHITVGALSIIESALSIIN